MSRALGLDIGGTKIAAAVFDERGDEMAQIIEATPSDYRSFLHVCSSLVAHLEDKTGRSDSLGVGVRGVFDHRTGSMNLDTNLPFLSGMPLRADLQRSLGRTIMIDNDANCAAFAEAMDGAGQGYKAVFSLILGTGVGGGYVWNGQLVAGANGLCGEIGHLPLPHYEPTDGVAPSCTCGQVGCIEAFIAGRALSRLHHTITGDEIDTKKLSAQATDGNPQALEVLDRYYTLVAKAMIVILYSFDPDIITVSGGLNALPGLYTEVPKRWGAYAINKNPVTQFVPARFGAMAGLRGAARLGQQRRP